MNADIFAEWLRGQGYRVIKTPSSYWYNAGARALQAFPYHKIIQPSEDELMRLLRENYAVTLRYSAPVDNPCGRISYHIVYDETSYSYDKLDRRSRQNIRKGLKYCRVERIPLEFLAEKGWALELDTMNRQNRKNRINRDQWRLKCLSGKALPGIEGWGAFMGERLVASILACQVEDCWELVAQQCHRDCLQARANNALVYVVTQELIKRPGIRSVFYTLQSLDAPASVDEFKLRMGYRAKAVRQRVVFHPWLRMLAADMSYVLIKKLEALSSGNGFLVKARGMLGFFREGNRPLSEQEWPECLLEYKQELD